MQPPSSKPTTTNKLPRNAIAHPSQLERRGLMGSSNRPEYQIAEVSPILPDFRPRSTPLSEKLWQEYRSRRLGHVKSPGFFRVEGAISAAGRTLRQPRAGPLTTHLPVLADKPARRRICAIVTKAYDFLRISAVLANYLQDVRQHPKRPKRRTE